MRKLGTQANRSPWDLVRLRALAALAKARGCYGMWVGVDVDNVAALATYRRAGAQEETPCVVQSWGFSKS